MNSQMSVVSCKLDMSTFDGCFRHTESLGLSGPSGESDSVFLGEPPEDELFGLPGGNYPKSQSNLMTHRQQSYMGMGFGGSRSGRDRVLYSVLLLL